MDTKARIELLVKELNAASDAYYGGQEEILTNFEWDSKFDELTQLETETGYILANSPTQTTSHAEDGDDNSSGVKEAHEYPALSLAKTKSMADLQKWAGDKPVWLSWKLDGLTLVCTYDDGKLTNLMTRGNGIIGTKILFMAAAIKGIPERVDYAGHLVVRGEATISYPDFERINDTLDDDDEKYANPRNLASGTLSLDESSLDKVKERNISFNAFTLVHTDKHIVSWGARMDLLDKLGFTTVARELTNADGLPSVVDKWTKKVESGEMQIPVDGLVLAYDDSDYATTGSVTGHHATRAGYAFKWQDEAVETTLDHIEWSCAASTITPVAVFDQVQIEGTTVQRASLCNLTELKRLGIGENRKTQVRVIKSNKIIPKVIAVKQASGTYTVPAVCPVCGAPTEIKVSEKSGVETLHCSNPDCAAKKLKKFSRFVSREGMDIDGLSIQSLKAFVNAGFIREFTDIYHLSAHADAIQEMDGFGKKSCQNLMAAIEKSRNANPVNFIKALCIPLIGKDAGKKMIAALGTDGMVERIRSCAGIEDIAGMGPERSGALVEWYKNDENKRVFEELLHEVTLQKMEKKDAAAGGTCSGLVFVITGDVHTFKNRDEFKAFVEAAGGSVTGSVSKKTNYLVNNDAASASSKNKKAHELNIPIITEDEFIAKFKS